MKNKIFLFACIIILSCSSQKNVPGQASSSTSDSVPTETTANNETKAATPTKSIILNNTEPAEKKPSAEKSTTISDKGQSKTDHLPACLQKLVKQIQEEDVQNPPRKIYSYIYNGNLVYYVTPPCCDFFSDLYDSQCRLIAHPDGGITGKGDGRARDFTETKSQEKLVWEDVRKYR